MNCRLSKVFPQSSISAANTKVTSPVLIAHDLCSHFRGPSFLSVAWLSGSARVRAAGVGIICDPPYSHLGPLFAPCLNLSIIVHRWLKRSRGTEQLWHYDRLAKQQSQLVRHWRQEWATLPTGKQSTTYNNTLSLQQEDSALRRWKDMHQQGIRRFLISQQMFTL